MTPTRARGLRPGGAAMVAVRGPGAYQIGVVAGSRGKGHSDRQIWLEARVPGTSSFTTRPQLAGTFGMVASTHWLASAAGMAVLEKGGNAFDAAVAAGLVLQVVEPHLNGPGGEVPVIGFDAADGEVFVLDGQGPAPAAATLDAFGALGLDLVPGTGLLAACVPAAAGTFREHWPSSAGVYLPGGAAPAPGARFRNPDLAAAYTRILDEAEAASADRLGQIEAARQAFYEGFVAEAIAGFLDR